MRFLPDGATPDQHMSMWLMVALSFLGMVVALIVFFVLMFFVMLLPANPNAALIALLSGGVGGLVNGLGIILGALTVLKTVEKKADNGSSQ